MFKGIAKRVLGTRNEREIKKIRPILVRVNELEDRFRKQSDDDLARKTLRFRERLDRGESLDEMLPEAFATVREAARRTLGMRPYDVQIVGAVFMHNGTICEMKTGEGKTLVATLPLYLNGLEGKGCHLVTVNDYLASRDAAWMGEVYNFLGLSVGSIVHDQPKLERKAAYASDITYGTNNEFGFDYLRDNMKFTFPEMVHRYLEGDDRTDKDFEFNFAIVDEVDSILIDEARTPLIISGAAEESSDLYYKINDVIPKLRKEEDFIVDEKAHSAVLTEPGVERVESIIRKMGLMQGGTDLYHPDNIELLHHVNQAVKAHTLYKREVNYLVKDGKVVIIDEFTGRLMPGRRWSDGLHQAVEAREGVAIESENLTLATISFQNYFRLYKKLAGMTGTADTEAKEFHETYKLDTVVIPTNEPVIREDAEDVVYKSERGKFKAVAEEIKDCQRRGQPVLVGTISVEKSEVLSKMLKRANVAHNVLNAKFHEREAEVVAQAGRKGAVTIATNMAGRGTDIVLGGNAAFLAKAESGSDDEGTSAYQKAFAKFQRNWKSEHQDVKNAGGLHILATERHESRRIDNQLRGRAGRQGDEGSSRFFLSLEDDLMRIFGSDRMQGLMDTLGMEEDEPIEHKWVTKALANAQKRVEGQHYDMRKHLLEYDDVMNVQRKTIYKTRRAILSGQMGEEMVLDMLEDVVLQILASTTPEGVHPHEWDMDGLREGMRDQFNIDFDVEGFGDQNRLDLETVQDQVWRAVESRWGGRCEEVDGIAAAMNERNAEDPNYKDNAGVDIMLGIARDIWLREIDTRWREHLQAMEHLREGIGLQGYAQKDPKKEYAKEGFALFASMMEAIKGNVVTVLMRIQLDDEESVGSVSPRRRRGPTKIRATRGSEGGGRAEKQATVRREAPKVGRNEPCPCGSGKKYKKCHLLEEEATA
jgi:preprotein translocase subunit SecA